MGYRVMHQNSLMSCPGLVVEYKFVEKLNFEAAWI